MDANRKNLEHKSIVTEVFFHYAFVIRSRHGGRVTIMGDIVDYAPVAATIFAIPQFLPQLLKLHRTRDAAGVSWPGHANCAVNNAAWAV